MPYIFPILTNYLSSSLFSPLFLPRALDDSAQAVQQPAEQIERMQRVIDAWQQQVREEQTYTYKHTDRQPYI